MAGLLGDYTPDPLAQGLLGLGGALLTPRQMGGGLAAGAQAFNQGAQQAALLRRQMQADAEQQQMMRERADMDRQKFGFEKQQYETGLAEQQRWQQVMAQVRSQIEQANPALLPLFDTNPQAAMERLFPKPQEAYTLAPGAVRMGADNKPLAENPRAAQPPAPTEIEKLIAARNALPKGSPDWKAVNDRIEALNYRQPPASMNVSYGAPFTGVDPSTNQPMLYQPSNRGGAPIATGLAPPPEKGKDLPEGAAKQVAGTRNLRDAISAYQAELQNWDRFSVVSPAKVAKMDTLYNNMMLQAKEAYNLGVLNGPDYEIMTRVVTPPASLKGMMYGSKALSDQANTLSGIAASIEKQVVAAHPGARPTTASANGGAGASGFSMLPLGKDMPTLPPPGAQGAVQGWSVRKVQ